MRRPIDRVRFVVLDSETTGLDPRTDRIITIGAVAVQDGEILLADSFAALLKVDRQHAGGRPSTASPATRAPKACRGAAGDGAFLDYLQDGVIVGHHIGHDIATLDAASSGTGARRFQPQPGHDGPDASPRARWRVRRTPADPPFTLDALCEMFGVIPHDRHTATGDAFITAQVFLRLVRLAAKGKPAHARRDLRAIPDSRRGRKRPWARPSRPAALDHRGLPLFHNAQDVIAFR